MQRQEGREEGEVDGRPEGERRRYYNPEQKDYATFLMTSEETGGERTLIEIEVAPGGGTPPHYHKTYEEHFEVLEGELEVRVGGETRVLGPGEKASVPLNTRHNFRNPTGESTTFLVELRPGSAGFEKALMAGYGLASDGKNPIRHPYYLAVILGWSDIRLPGVFTVAEPLLRLLERQARRKGVDRELEERYCR
jgi:mannose-6-phosphate isomerase-like protein (cupin superfamily)